MCNNKVIKRFTGILLSLIFLGVMIGTASAVTDVYLRAESMVLTLPDGLGGTTGVPVWGFAQDSAFGAGDGTVSVPGPLIDVPAGETSLVIHLDNNLPEPVSIQIQGLVLTNNTGPVWANLDNTVVSSGARPAGNFSTRVRSFSHETPSLNGTEVTYEFNVTNRPGTFMYSSATNPAKHVQMGLYGAVKFDLTAGEAYPGVFYDKELILIYSEMDPVMQAAISAGTYGYHADPVPAGWITSSLHREPKYFLINGAAYEPGGSLDQVLFADPFDRVLVRFLNAGYETHIPQLLNMYMSLVAEDGNPYTHHREQYGIQLPAGKTMDAILSPTSDGIFSIHDAALNLTNGGTASAGGMLAYYAVGCVGDLTPVDGKVNVQDLGTLKADFGRIDCHDPGMDCAGDINNDGRVNVVDLGLLRANFGRADCPIP